MKDRTAYIKGLTISVLLFVVSYFLTKIISDFTSTKNLFTPTLEFSFLVISCMLLLSYLISLVMCSNQNIVEYVLSITAINLAILLGMPVGQNFLNILLLHVVITLLMIVGIHISKESKASFIKIHPSSSFRYAVRSVTTSFAISAAAMLLIGDGINDFNLGKTVSKAVSEPFQQFLEEQYTNAIGQQLNETMLPQNLEIPREFQDKIGLQNPKDRVEETISSEINNFIRPYASFIRPSMAILIYALFQFYALISRTIYLITIDWVVKIGISTNLIKVSKIQVEKEELSF